jgi:hypothetical protein
MTYQELNEAIEKSAVEHLEKYNIEINVGTKHAAMCGLYKTMMSYLTEEQIEDIVKIHKLEI